MGEPVDNPKVTLGRPRREPDRSWHTDPLHRTVVRVTRTFSRWRSRQGWKIHRARYATIYGHIGHMHIDYWCGSGTNRGIPFNEECAEGTEPCAKCEGLYQAHLEGRP